MRSVKNSLALASLGVLIASASCTLITDVDRSKIPTTDAGTPSGEGGDDTSSNAGSGNVGNTAGSGGAAGSTDEAGAPAGGAADNAAGAAGTAGSP